MALQVFAFHLPGLNGECEAAQVVVAAPTAAKAARTIREAGWHGVRWQAAKISRDSDEIDKALSEPNVAWWYPWTEDPPRNWHRG